MNLLSWLLLIAVIGGFIAALIRMIKRKGGCSCGCNGCSSVRSGGCACKSSGHGHCGERIENQKE